MSESICDDCLHFKPISTGVYECRRYSGMRANGVKECDGFETDEELSGVVEVEPPSPTRKSCLSAAWDAVVGGREVAYGSPEDNFARIARLWAAFLHNKTGQDIDVSETDVALMLDLVKTARLQHNPGHIDSWVDKAGYSACGCEIGGRA